MVSTIGSPAAQRAGGGMVSEIETQPGRASAAEKAANRMNSVPENRF
jgi:hypothetical protein